MSVQGGWEGARRCGGEKTETERKKREKPKLVPANLEFDWKRSFAGGNGFCTKTDERFDFGALWLLAFRINSNKL